MVDYRNAIIAVIIAILFAIFVHSMVDVFIENPDYSDCSPRAIEPNMSEKYEYNQSCYDAQNDIREKNELIRFLVTTIVGVIAVIVGMYISIKEPVGMAIASGFLLGGLFSIFTGTLSGWGSISEIIRPIIILIEIVLVIWVAYKKLR